MLTIKIQAAVVASLILFAASGRTCAAEPRLFQADTGYICPLATPLQEHLDGVRREDDWRQECLAGLPAVVPVPVVVLDVEDYPFVWVCTNFRVKNETAKRPLMFVCGYTLAKWILDENKREAPKAVLVDAARRSTMADVRRLGSR